MPRKGEGLPSLDSCGRKADELTDPRNGSLIVSVIRPKRSDNRQQFSQLASLRKLWTATEARFDSSHPMIVSWPKRRQGRPRMSWGLAAPRHLPDAFGVHVQQRREPARRSSGAAS
jgi:hypothetical protein